MNLSQSIRFLSRAGRIEVLEFLLAQPKRRFTLNGLARASGVPVSTVWRAVQDLSDLGLVIPERIANSVLVQINEQSPATKALGRLEIPNPQLMAYEEFALRLKRALPGLGVRLFGSVAQGKASPSSDVDVMVAFEGSGHSKREVENACAKLAVHILDRFRIVVSPLIVARPVVLA